MTKNLFFAICALVLNFSLYAAEVTVGEVKIKAKDDIDINPTDAVLSMCAVQAGVKMEQVDLQKAISADVQGLLSTPYYSEASAAIGVAPDGKWTVEYTIARRYSLANEPTILGLDGAIRMSKARKELKLEPQDRIDDAIVATAAERLRQAIIRKDYVNATVTYSINNTRASGYADVVFMVDPGKERNIRDYLFDGNTAYDHDTLAGKFEWVPLYNPLGWFRDFPVTDEKLDDARASVNEFYVSEGYLDAEVEKPNLRPVRGKDKVDACFKINEGPRYRIGTITVDGAVAYPKENLERVAYDLMKRDGNIATRKNLTNIQSAIENFYGARGYIDTYAAMQTVGDSKEDGVINLKFKLNEGERVRIRSILVRGNTITQDKVIRREIVIQPGENYNSELVERSKNRLQNLNYFLPASESGVTTYSIKTDEPGVRDLAFTVREKQTGDYGIGLGISSVDNVFVFASASQNNFDLFNPSNGFRGGGQRARASVEIGGRRQTAEVSWTQPWLMDMPLSLTLTAYHKLRWYDHYDQRNTGISATLAWKPEPIPLPWGHEFQMNRIGVRYTLEAIRYSDVDVGTWYRASDNKPFRYTDEEDGINSKARLFWDENHRNRPFIPTSGWESIVYAEVGVGGDAKDYGIGFNFIKWWNPWFDHVIMTRFRFDAVEAYSGNDVLMFDRYFIGGGRTIRGFDYRDGGPKAYSGPNKTGDHVAIGGRTLWCGTIEYSIPLISVLRFAAFTDFGAVSDEFCDFSGDLLWSVGVGLRIDLEQFPIRLDFAVPITNDDNTDEEVFTFWLGVD